MIWRIATLTPSTSNVVLSLRNDFPDNGEFQSGEAGTTLPRPLRVRVHATDGHGVVALAQSVPVAWILPGTTSSTLSTTDAAGTATMPVLPGQSIGRYIAQAQLAANPSIVDDFPLTAVAGKGASLYGVFGDSQTISPIHTSPSSSLAMTTLDRFRNPSPSARDVQWRVLDGPMELLDDPASSDKMNSHVTVRPTGATGIRHARATLTTSGTTLDFVVFFRE